MHTKDILSKYGTTPSKGLGQNFLIDKNVLQKIIKTAGLKPNDIILEIGPGIGTLTQELAKTAGKVIAIEKDPKMCEILQKTLNNYKNIEITQGDILKIDTSKININSLINHGNDYAVAQTLPTFEYKVVANLPYYITSPVIRKFLESKYPPAEMVLMVQKEVAQRICAKPPKMSLLAVSVQFYTEPEIISYVSKNCFWPSPKVDSAIIKITPSKNVGDPISHKFVGDRVSPEVSPELFFEVVKAGFSQPRKQLGNNLSKMLKTDRKKINEWLSKNGINPSQRAETLSIDDWIKLANNYKK